MDINFKQKDNFWDIDINLKDKKVVCITGNNRTGKVALLDSIISTSEHLNYSYEVITLADVRENSTDEMEYVLDVLDRTIDYILIDKLGSLTDVDNSKYIIDKIIASGKKVIFTTINRTIINSVDIENIIFLVKSQDGIIRNIDVNRNKEIIEDFKFTGLNNFDFLMIRFWKYLEDK